MNSLGKTITIKDKILVYSYVFYALWSFVYGFLPIEGGIGDIMKSIHAVAIVNIYITLLTLFQFIGNRKSISTKGVDSGCAFLFIICYIIFSINFFGGQDFNFLEFLVNLFLIATFFILRDDLRVYMLDGFIRCLSLLLFLSIIEYVVWVFLDERIVLFYDAKYHEKVLEETCFNFMRFDGFFSFVNPNLYRFQSLAPEPGDVGTMSALLLFATANNKKYNFDYAVFWVAGILSFSLAFFFMATFHLIVLSRISGGKKNGFIILIIAVIALALYLLFEDAFASLILDRLKDEDMDNRVDYSVHRYFIQSWENGSLWFGFGPQVANNFATGMGAGLKVSLLINGIIGVVFFVLSYVYAFIIKMKQYKLIKSIYLWAFFIVFWLSYYQRDYIAQAHFRLVYFTMPMFLLYNSFQRDKKV